MSGIEVISLIEFFFLYLESIQSEDGLRSLFSSPRHPRPLDSASWKDCISLKEHNQFHGVWDIPLTGDGDWSSQSHQLVEERINCSPVLRPQDADKIRLTIREASRDRQLWDSEAISGFTALSSQWGRDNSYPWYHIKTYETRIPARVLRCIRVSVDQEQRRQVELECRTFLTRQAAKQLQPQLFLTERLFKELEALDAHYRPIRANENWKQAFLLQFHHASLRFFAEFLATLALKVGRGNSEDIDPSRAKLRRWILIEMTKRSYECRDLQEIAQELVSTSESLIEVLKGSATIAGVSQKANKFMPVEAELRGYCREVKERLQKLSDDIEHDLKFLELAKNVNQTRDVQQLTLLATIFLPLSLAAGVLSMQTRFRDLGSLLYDFFGVVVLLGAIVVIIWVIMTAIAIAKEGESRHLTKNVSYRNHRHIFMSFLILGFFSYGSLILSSFLVGMFKDVPLGAKILGYGSAAAVGLIILLALLVPPAYLLYRRFCDFRSRAKNQKGKIRSEDGPEGVIEDIQLEARAPREHESLEGIAIEGSEMR